MGRPLAKRAKAKPGGATTLKATPRLGAPCGPISLSTSRADPLQYAEGRVFLLNMDNDADSEQDALDMGAIAFSYYLTSGLTYFHSVYEAPWVDDADVGAFTDAMKAAWPAR